MAKVEKYGLKWPEGTDALQIEMEMIRRGGTYKKTTGEIVGNGLPFHYESMRRILWPHLDGEAQGQRWHVLMRDEIIKNKVTVLMGPGSSGKTHTPAWMFLCDYWIDPENTCVLVSSTDIRGLRLRVWGEICMLWELGIKQFDYLAGHMLDSKLAITTDQLSDDGDFDDRVVRDMRKGIIGIPTVQNGKQVGLGKWIGLKQKKVYLIADEAQFMGSSFLSAFANLNKNEQFKAVVLGNPNDFLDPLGKAAEPLDGWDTHLEPEKTAIWKTRFMGGTCVNLIGTDSPNFDFPSDQPTRFKYLISREKIAETLSFFPKDSFEYYSQCVGAMKIGNLARRVLTRRMCEDGLALETEVVWLEEKRTRIYFVDAAYGGDRCVGGWGEFGKVVGGQVVLLLHPPVIVPVSVATNAEPEQQIAEFMKAECEGLSIPAENVGHDSTGRGSLGTFIARVWSAACHPVESGGEPTDRPVSLDMFVYDIDEWGRPVKRLKTCKEHYRKLITEYWFSVRYGVQAKQIRGLSSDTMEEFCQREWDLVNAKIEIETKLDMKARIGRSPDLADWAAGVLEMARRKGFQIAKLANSANVKVAKDWFGQKAREQDQVNRENQLQTAA